MLPATFYRRPDGIVLIDHARCVRCNKCRVDCPYEAIRYEAATNTVSKCDFCADEIEAGLEMLGAALRSVPPAG